MNNIIRNSLLFIIITLLFIIIPSPAFAANSSNFTLSLWVNPTTSVASKTILSKAEEFRMFTNASGFVGCQTKTTTWQTATQATSKALVVGTWAHVVCTYDLVKLTVFVNGIQVAQTSLTAVADDTANVLKIGQDDSASSPYTNLSGTIDEFKFYNYALTADEVKTDYNHGSALILGAAGNNSTYQINAQNQEYCVPGDATSCVAPVGEWKFEEKSGQTANDTSGNGNNGTLGASSSPSTDDPTWGIGKFGGALKFDGSNDYVVMSNASAISSNATMEGWFKWQNTGTASMLTRDHSASGGWILGLSSSGNLSFRVGGSEFATGISLTPYQNFWTHYAVTKNEGNVVYYLNGIKVYSNSGAGSTANVSPWYFMRNGYYDSGYVQGLADEIRIFAYARTPAQIAWDYSKGKAVGYWRFDECTGSTVKDYSGNAVNATITIGTGAGTGHQDSTGTCSDGTGATAWNNGAVGKRNYSLKLDGIDDFLTTSAFSPLATAAQTTTTLSWGGWFYPTTSVANRYLMEKATNSTTAGEFHLYVDANSMPICGIFYSSAFHDSAAPTQALTLSAWNHVICTYDGTNINTYLNGKLIKQSAETTAVTAISSILYLGEPSTSPSSSNRFEGQLDDVRIYNYPLTGTLVDLLMNNGAVTFAPSTGSP